MAEDFETECRRKFAEACADYVAADFHIDKRIAVAAAYEAIDAFLDWQAVQAL